MLRVEFVNDMTADPKYSHFCANYKYTVYINDEVIAVGRIENVNTVHGWKGLVSCLGSDVFANPEEEGGECKSVIWEKEADAV